MRHASARLYGLIRPVVEALGYELVGIEYAAGSRSGLLRVYIDGAEGIGVEDCRRVSHQVSGVLDVEDPIPGHYNLEVSSPGLDRPLFEPEHFDRFAGQTVRVRLRSPREGRRNFKGLLQGITGDQVVLAEDGEEVRLPFAEIERARLVPEL